jgi:hypothetical protein
LGLAWIWRVQQGAGPWQPLLAACLQDVPCLFWQEKHVIVIIILILLILIIMQAAEEGSLGPGALLGIAVPLLQQVIVEGDQSLTSPYLTSCLCLERRMKLLFNELLFKWPAARM